MICLSSRNFNVQTFKAVSWNTSDTFTAILFCETWLGVPQTLNHQLPCKQKSLKKKSAKETTSIISRLWSSRYDYELTVTDKSLKNLVSNVQKVENTLFRVPKSGLDVEGTVFETMFTLPPSQENNGCREGSTDKNPITLNEISKAYFRGFLRSIYRLCAYPSFRNLILVYWSCWQVFH